jgi:hypothetical protein
MERISRDGWSSVGVDSGNPPTLWGVVDAAIDALGKQKGKK